MDKLKQTMTYKGYVGSVEFSDADGVFFGKVSRKVMKIMLRGRLKGTSLSISR